MERVLIIESWFYRDIAATSFEAAKSALQAHNLSYDLISVPGALDIASAFNFALEAKDYAGVVVLGTVVRGGSYHFEVVCQECTRSIADLAVHYSVPLGFGIIMVDSKEDAEARAVDYAQRAVTACVQLIQIKKQFQDLYGGEVPVYSN